MTIDDPQFAQITLGILLREQRKRTGSTAAEAAQHVGLSAASMSKVENGKQSITAQNVATLLEYFDADDATTAEALKLAAVPRSRARQRGGASYRDAVPNWFMRHLVLEAEASEITEYANELVPGILQTENYARTLLQAGSPFASKAEIDKQVEVRMGRQRILARDNPEPPRLDVIVHEAVLHRVIGDDQIMNAQLTDLLELSELPNVYLCVLPFRPQPTRNRDEAFAAQMSFKLLKLPDRATILYLEDITGATYPEDVALIQQYAGAYQRLAAAADDPGASRKLIAKIAKQYR